ncbi:MAG: hypothetical protein J7L26_12715 [Candidatus Aminicenantes bacterium]|nr:hypothetical protein [Candidatus Aminicenantes bacterium]
MASPIEVNEIIEELRMTLCPRTEINDLQREKYFFHLQRFSKDKLRKAVDILLETYDRRSMPLISDILKAIKELETIEGPKEIKPIDCSHCSGTGFLFGEKKFGERDYPYVYPCPFCITGEKRKAGIKKHLNIEEEENTDEEPF